MEKINCFVSYCHEKIDRDSLDFFVKHLKNRRLFPNMQVHFDMHDRQIRNWNEYMKLIDNAHIVIMICTPNYKERAINHTDGAGEEYKRIVKRYYEMKDKSKETIDKKGGMLSDSDISNFDLIPIIINGSKDNSIPKIVTDENINYYDLSTFSILPSKDKGKTKLEIPRLQKDSYEEKFKDIKYRIEGVKKYYDGGYEENYKKVWNDLKIDALFKQTKADFNFQGNIEENYHKSLFVQTYPYKQAHTQSHYIFVGRKGSGKSALLQVSSIKMAKNFSYIIPIDRSKMDIITPHNLFTDEITSDSLFLSKRTQLFSYAWRLYFRLQVLECIVSQYFRLSKQAKTQNYYANEIESVLIPKFEQIVDKKLKDYLESHPEREKRNHYFIYSMRAAINYLQKCIKKARPEDEYFFSDIESIFNYNELLDNTFGKNISDIIEKIVKYQRKNILITFDDADTYYNITDYPDKKESIHKFEIDFLYGLLSLVNDIKQLKKGDKLAPYFDFIITISSEHLLEIIKSERDAYRVQEYYSVVSWTGIELALMARKRLAEMANFQIIKQQKKNENSVINTLNEVLSKKYKFLPNTIKITLEEGSKYEMHIFLYILRFTFWRPRDILRYFAKILTYSIDNKGVNKRLDSETVRQIVKKTTIDIIESEFINEYSGYINNIRDIVNCFYGCEQLLKFDEIENRIGNVEICFTDACNADTMICKIKHLYQIGFLGIYASPDVKNKYNLESDTAFIFTEGAEIINTLSDHNKETFTYTIHPIFQSYLHIKMNKKILLSNYNWEYLIKMEDLMRAANHSFVVKF